MNGLSYRPFRRRGFVQGYQAMTDDRWLSVDEIATHLGVKRDTIYKWIERKGLPANKVGRLWKFKLDEVDSWVRSGNKNDGRVRSD